MLRLRSMTGASGVAAAAAAAAAVPSAKGDEPEAVRADAISWDDYFMGVAFLTAMRSKDPSTQVGACIVNPLNRIVGVGYNGFPTGCPNHALPWNKECSSGMLGTKYPYVVHAELNAVMNKNAESCRGCVLYSTLFPCNECAKVIIQAGITCVVYASDKHKTRESSVASRRLFQLAKVQLRQYTSSLQALHIPLRYPEDEPLPEPSPPRPPRQRRRSGGQAGQLRSKALCFSCCVDGSCCGSCQAPSRLWSRTALSLAIGAVLLLLLRAALRRLGPKVSLRLLRAYGLRLLRLPTQGA